MDYVATLKFRPSSTAAERDAALMRRANGWKYPSGVTPIAEYWPAASELQVVSIFSADDYASVMEVILEWHDVFDINVYPAVSAEEGLNIGAEVYPRLSRVQQ